MAEVCMVKRVCLDLPAKLNLQNLMKSGLCNTKYMSLGHCYCPIPRKIRCGFKVGDQVCQMSFMLAGVWGNVGRTQYLRSGLR